VANLVRSDATLRELYAAAFDGVPAADDDAVLVGVGKALAAFQETLVSERTPFDEFRDALARDDREAAARLSLAAQRGLRVFEGRGRCAACHSGATFSDGGFHRSLIASQPSSQRDAGRQAGVQSLLANPLNRLGRFNDGADRSATLSAANETHRDGAFRTPGLREVAKTGPYMHDGSVGNLCEALRPHALPDAGGAAPRLSLAERRDLVAFLRSLSVTADSPLVDEAIFRCR
jgi:cytochrome c peroxidase